MAQDLGAQDLGTQDLAAQQRDNALWGEQQLARQQALARDLELRALENRLDTAANLTAPRAPSGLAAVPSPALAQGPDDLAAVLARTGAILKEKR